MQSVLIVDDHPLMADATQNLVQEIEGLSSVTSVRNGEQALTHVRDFKPGLVILDILLPDMSGVEVAEIIKKDFPRTKVIIFSGADVNDILPKLIEVKVNGAITKGVNHTCFKSTIQIVMEGYNVFPDSIHSISVIQSPSGQFELTDDEVTILNMIVSGRTLDQIAEKIHISRRSVDNYQRRIYEKLGVKGRAQAVEAFVRSKYYQHQ